MSKRGIIQPEPARVCELCGAFEECRPYGPNNEQICYDCGQKNLEVTQQKMAEYLGFNTGEPLILRLDEEKEESN